MRFSPRGTMPHRRRTTRDATDVVAISASFAENDDDDCACNDDDNDDDDDDIIGDDDGGEGTEDVNDDDGDDVRDDGMDAAVRRDDNDDDDDLSWRVAKLRLEEANTRRFLKARPVKLSYETSRSWIRKNYGIIRTRGEFMDLVDNGYVRNPYISKDPERYYGSRGEWISWDHYLLGACDGDGDGDNDGVGVGVPIDGDNVTGVVIASSNRWQ